ncbi:hypothetical protein [Serratia marcescens]|uniref:hypothetical protein n=1 Tax=Serratia marcescens TaxID=615 RepID=UPI003F7E0C2D
MGKIQEALDKMKQQCCIEELPGVGKFVRYGDHGFYNIRVNYCPFDNEHYLCCEFITADGEQGDRLILNRKWFDDLKSRMAIAKPGKYRYVKWQFFQSTISSIAQLNY